MSNHRKTFYITTPIYYVNAKPHIGHLYTTIAADVVARWQRQQNKHVLFSTGTDENSQKNVEAAEKAGQPVQEYVDAMAKTWEETFRKLNLSYDVFIRTTDPKHEVAVKTLLTKLQEKGDIYLGEYEGYYCTGCEAFKAENEIVDGKCPIHHTVLEKIKEANYFFKLTKYKDALLKHYTEHPEFVQPESAKHEILNYIQNDLKDISISRQSQEWGIRLPQNPEHAVYVWFDALINYLTVAGYPDDQKKLKEYWPADVHLVGRDIIKFHCAIWPAMLLAADLALPKRIFANGFFTIDGVKISKSLGNAIDPLELAKEYPLDAIRYFLLRDIPYGNDGDFSQQRLLDRYNSDLANGLGNLVSRLLNMIEKFTPEIQKNGSANTALKKTVEQHLEQFAFDKALEAIWQRIAYADEQIEQHKPWQMAKEGKQAELDTLLGNLLTELWTITDALKPFMPELHQKLNELLSAESLKKPAEPLFARK